MVAMPKKADTHIQKMAPGPPEASAVAQPVMLPVPTCAATAVVSAWKLLMPSLPAALPLQAEPAEQVFHAGAEPAHLHKAQPQGERRCRCRTAETAKDCSTKSR